MVTTSESNASRIGAEVLRRGGNAIDAAAAVQFALNVVQPQSSGIGGGGFMMIHLAKKKQTVIVDSRETAPATAPVDMFVPFLAQGNQAFNLASTSGVAVGVPGTLLGVATALEKWGTISLAEALTPAIKLAEDGFRVGPRLAESSESSRLQNELDNPAYEIARQVFRPGNLPLEEGEILVQPDLAKTFRLIAEGGVSVFYEGVIADEIINTQLKTRTFEGNDIPGGVGYMSLEDLQNYRVAIRTPVVDNYRGVTVKSMGPPSSGALTVLQILKMIERFPIGDEKKGFGFGSTRTLNVMIEAMRLAFADRAIWMGDEDFVHVPKAGLLNDDYIAMRSALIDPDSSISFVEADDPRPFDTPKKPHKGKLAKVSSGLQKGINTTHFSIVDRHGNVVSYTTTVESGWGTGLMVTGYGFLLNNELTDFNFEPAYNPDPDNYNPGANDVAGNKRPRSSMSPTILFKNGKPIAAYGSPGGSTIIGSVLNVTLNLIDHKMDVQEAVDAPRIAQTSANGSASWEMGFAEEVLTELGDLGQSLRSGPSEIGSVQAVIINKNGQLQYGAADRRSVGSIVTLTRDEIED